MLLQVVRFFLSGRFGKGGFIFGDEEIGCKIWEKIWWGEGERKNEKKGAFRDKLEIGNFFRLWKKFVIVFRGFRRFYFPARFHIFSHWEFFLGLVIILSTSYIRQFLRDA